jgi:hypothetical protein
MRNVRALFYEMLPDFQKNVASLKYPRLRPFVLLITSIMQMKMSMEQRWNDIDREDIQYLEKNLSQCCLNDDYAYTPWVKWFVFKR